MLKQAEFHISVPEAQTHKKAKNGWFFIISIFPFIRRFSISSSFVHPREHEKKRRKESKSHDWEDDEILACRFSSQTSALRKLS